MELDQRDNHRGRYKQRGVPLLSLRTARQQAALSQQQLAKSAGVSPNTVRLLESGKRNAYPTTLRKLSVALGVPPSMLIQVPSQE